MSRASFRLLLLLLIGTTCTAAVAAPPSTLGYQGRLAAAGGQPINATLAITFRLYEVPSGGSALWTETQPGIEVDGGNLAVELGSVTPLPTTIWGRQLYLGVQVAGDSEMLPRPALTASPFALRAATTMKRTIVVSAEGTPTENGTALLAAVTAISGATATSPVAVEIDAGTFDLGSTRLQPPAYVTLAGRGQGATKIASANPEATIVLESHSTLRDAMVTNTGLPQTADEPGVAISARAPGTQTLRQNIVLERVTGFSVAATGALGPRTGIVVCASDSRLTDVTGAAEGGQFAMGLRMDCPLSGNNVVDGARVYAYGASEGVRGAYLAGSGDWSGIEAEIEMTPGMFNAYGIRILDDGVFGPPAILRNSRVTIDGDDLVSPTQTLILSGVQVEYLAEVDFDDIRIGLHGVKGARIAGLRVIADSLVAHAYSLRDIEVDLSGVQDAALAWGGLVGLRLEGAMPHIVDADIRVRCESGGYNLCHGIGHVAPTAPPASNTSPQGGSLRIEDSRVLVTNVDPADNTAQTAGIQLLGPARIQGSHIRAERSADGEVAFGVQFVGGNLELVDSTVEQIDPSGPSNGCAIGGGGNAELLANVMQGQLGCGTGITLACAGNTRRGVGFVASGCP